MLSYGTVRPAWGFRNAGRKRELAFGLNNNRQVVGYSDTNSGQMHAFLWQSTLAGNDSRAYAINSSRQIVGTSLAAANRNDAFLWEAGTGMQDLGDVSWMGLASAINDAGQVVGVSLGSSSALHTFLSTGGSMVDLNTLLPPDSGWILRGAPSINDAGEIVSYVTIWANPVRSC